MLLDFLLPDERFRTFILQGLNQPVNTHGEEFLGNALNRPWLSASVALTYICPIALVAVSVMLCMIRRSDLSMTLGLLAVVCMEFGTIASHSGYYSYFASPSELSVAVAIAVLLSTLALQFSQLPTKFRKGRDEETQR